MIDTLFSRWAGLKSEGGFALLELLLASVLSVVVLGALFTVLDTSGQVQARDTEWALTMQEDRAGLSQMTREIRQASTPIEEPEAKESSILFYATIGGKIWKVEYECGHPQEGTTYDECLRLAVSGTELSAVKAAKLPSTGPALVRDLLNGTKVFKYFKEGTVETKKAPNVVTLKIELPAKGTLKQAGSSGYTHSVVLENAAFIRNQDLSG